MNLRILKKLSKRAAPYLDLLGDRREQFRASHHRDGENYTGLLIRARKHFERMRSPHAQLIREGEMRAPARDGRGYIVLWPPDHPRKGTVMVGYYEPEWSEQTAWEALVELVRWHFTDCSDEELRPTRALKKPAAIFCAADEMLAEIKGAAA
jgi:hypothetical protein